MDTLEKFFIDTNPASLGLRFILLVAIMFWVLRWLVRWRIGSFNAISVESWTRLIMAIVACNLICVVGYQLLLLIRPAESWLRFGLFAAAAPIGVLVFGMVQWMISATLDHGRALAVFTSRYQLPQHPKLEDLTVEGGRRAQLIGRSVLYAYIMLQIVGILVALALRLK